MIEKGRIRRGLPQVQQRDVVYALSEADKEMVEVHLHATTFVDH